MKILWVEDQPHDNRVYSDALAEHPSKPEIRYAASVVQALALLGSQEFDVIILDLNIPLGRDAPDELIDGHLNGKHVVTYLDKEQRLPALRVLCLTNFYERARNELGDKAVIVKKGTFVADFLRAVFP